MRPSERRLSSDSAVLTRNFSWQAGSFLLIGFTDGASRIDEIVRALRSCAQDLFINP